MTAPARGFGWERGTMRKAALVLGAFGLLLYAGSWLIFEPTAKPPLHRYTELGERAGAAALQHDLAAEASLSVALQRLAGLGFSCTAEDAAGQAWRCNHYVAMPSRSTLHAQVTLRAEGGVLRAVEARFRRQTS